MYTGLSYVKLIFVLYTVDKISMSSNSINKVIEVYNKLIAEHGSEEIKAMVLADEFQSEVTKAIGKTKKACGRSRKAKDPNKPKKPTTTWLLFCADERASVRKDNPQLKMSEISSLLSPMWANLQASTTSEDIARIEKYKAVVEEQREAYKESMANYTGSGSSEEDGASKPKSKPKKIKPEPKPPKSGYQLFMKMERAKPKPDGETFGETTKRISAMWKELKETDPEQVERLCNQAKAGLVVQPVEETKDDTVSEASDEEVPAEDEVVDDIDAILSKLTTEAEEEEEEEVVEKPKPKAKPKTQRRPKCVKKSSGPS